MKKSGEPYTICWTNKFLSFHVLNPLPYLMNRNRLTKNHSVGFSILEVVVVAGILAIVIAGSAKFFPLALKTANLLHSQQSESDWRHFLTNTVTDTVCQKTFDGKNIGQDITQIIGETGSPPTDTVFFDIGSEGETFQRNFRIVKMQVTETEGGATAGRAVWQMYFHRDRSLFDRKGSQPCTRTDTSGCYEHQCELMLEQTNTGVTGQPVGPCFLRSCSNRGTALHGQECPTGDVIKEGDRCLPDHPTPHFQGRGVYMKTTSVDGTGCPIYMCDPMSKVFCTTLGNTQCFGGPWAAGHGTYNNTGKVDRHGCAIYSCHITHTP